MVMSQNESNISTNIRAIIEQLNLNAVERHQLINRNSKSRKIDNANSSVKVEIGVYGDTNVHNHITESKNKKNEIKGEEVACKPNYQQHVDSLSSSNMIIDIWRAHDNGKIETSIEESSIYGDKLNVDMKARGNGENQKKIQVSKFKNAEMRQRIPDEQRNYIMELNKCVQASQTSQPDAAEQLTVLSQVDLPEFEGLSLNHTAAHHRISVRPKNRRPPRRTTPAITNITNSLSSLRITTISENTDTLDSLELVTDNAGGNTNLALDKSSAICKSSNQLSKICDANNDYDTKMSKSSTSIQSLSPDSLDMTVTKIIIDNCKTDDDCEMKSSTRKPSNSVSRSSRDKLDILKTNLPDTSPSILYKHSKSPDSLVNFFSKSSDGCDKLIESKEVISTLGKLQNFRSKSTDGFDRLLEQLEVKPIIPKRIASKSTEIVNNVDSYRSPGIRGKQHLHHLNDTHDDSKFSNNLETSNALLIRDDSIEPRRSSFEIPPRRNIKAMSMSSENFDTLEKLQQFEKRNSVADVHLSSVTRYSRMINKGISKSTESFDTIITNLNEKKHKYISTIGKNYWEVSSRAMRPNSSDNLELDDHAENEKLCKPSKRNPSSNMTDMLYENSNSEDDRRPIPMKKPFRFQKHSESSELGSTDTLNSDKRNKMFDSTETIDSLERSLENNSKNEQYHKNESRLTAESESDVSNANDNNNENNANNESSVENTSFVPTNKSYWRQKSDSKENIDIRQLLAITIVSRITDNSNNQRNSVRFPQKNHTLSPTSPIDQQEGNKLLFNNLLVNKNDEELQNMLNGNISEVSTDTKSFKEKLIMFEKLGK